MHWRALLTTLAQTPYKKIDSAEHQTTAIERRCLHTHPCSGEMASACVTQGRQRGLAPLEAATNARAGLHDVCKTERCMAMSVQFLFLLFKPLLSPGREKYQLKNHWFHGTGPCMGWMLSSGCRVVSP